MRASRSHVQHRRLYPGHRLIAVTVLAALAQTAGAADPYGQYGVRGAALVPCSIYERERQAESEVYRVIASWMDGYITAINQHVDDTYDVASFESTELLAAVVSEHCKKNPDAAVFAVVKSLLEQFAENRLRRSSKKVEVAVGEYRVMLYEEVLERIQQRLADAGHYQGRLDGIYDAEMQASMRAFQESIELEPTGFPDQLTLYRLFYSE